MNPSAIISQCLVPEVRGGGFVPAIKIMLKSPLANDLIFKGKIDSIRDTIGESGDEGMITFEQSLLELFEKGLISYEDPKRSADSVNNLHLRIKFEGESPGVRKTWARLLSRSNSD